MMPHDEDNLVICQLATLEFGVTRVVAVANDPDNAEVLEKLGVSAFSTTEVLTSLIEERAALDQIVNLLPIGQGLVHVTEILLADDSPVAGKLLREIDLPSDALVVVVVRDKQPIVPRGNSELRAGDRVVLVTLPDNHSSVVRTFTGERR